MGRECSNVIGLSLNESSVNCCLLVVTCVVSINYANGWFVWKAFVLKMSGIADAPERQKLKLLSCRDVTVDFCPCKRLSTVMWSQVSAANTTTTPATDLNPPSNSKWGYRKSGIISNFENPMVTLCQRSIKLSSTQEAGSNAYLTLCWRSLRGHSWRLTWELDPGNQKLLTPFLECSFCSPFPQWELFQGWLLERLQLRPPGLNWWLNPVKASIKFSNSAGGCEKSTFPVTAQDKPNICVLAY